jgi:hypothetical protein
MSLLRLWTIIILYYCLYQYRLILSLYSKISLEASINPFTMPTSATTVGNLPNVTYGFIGIGVMGWGMAHNLRREMPKSSPLIICEIDKPRRERFVAETEGLIKVAESPKEVSEQAVSHPNIHTMFRVLTCSLGHNNYHASQRPPRP